MKTKAELEKDITNITTKIHQEFPELSKYIIEMPENFSEKDNAQVGAKSLQEYYNSLEEVLAEYAKTHVAKEIKNNSATSKPEGYPLYPPSEDIYNRGKEEQDINPANISKNKTPNPKRGALNEKDFSDDKSGDDLDVPGSELDDKMERIGSEDEENNYYSLGGDNHNDLEEDKG